MSQTIKTKIFYINWILNFQYITKCKIETACSKNVGCIFAIILGPFIMQTRFQSQKHYFVYYSKRNTDSRFVSIYHQKKFSLKKSTMWCCLAWMDTNIMFYNTIFFFYFFFLFAQLRFTDDGVEHFVNVTMNKGQTYPNT